MKKNIFKILLLALFLFIPLNVFASDGETDKLYINIDIKEDGSIDVKELASLEGSYNGRLRDIYFANLESPNFTGKISDFESSNIYNGTSLTNLVLYGVRDRDNITFNSMYDKTRFTKEFTNVVSAANGEKQSYTKIDKQNGVDLKIFNPSTTNEAFYIEYTVENAVVVHNDVAELAWNILGDTYQDNINNMEVHVNLPSTDENLKVWLRGPLNGYIENKDNKYAKVIYDFLGARNAVSVRLMFDKSLVAYATKLSGVNGKENILKVEKIAADKANKERELIKRQNKIVVIISCIWYLLMILISVIFFLKKKKCDKSDFNQTYLRTFPNEYGPEIVSYLINKEINEKSMSASILMMVEKKALKVLKDEDKKNNYTFVKEEKNLDKLTEQELFLLNTLIDDIGNGLSVSLEQIKKYGRNLKKAQEFIKKYDKWKLKTVKKAANENFFLTNISVKVFAILISILGIGVSFLNFIFETGFILGYLSIIIAIIMTIIFSTTKFRTKKGVDDYKKWMALKNFMVDFGTMDEKELPEITLWGKYLVYATVLGCARELEKTMKVKIDSMNLSSNYSNYYMFDSFTDNIFIMSQLTSSVNNAVTQAVASSRSSIAASYSSSSSGSGGGASFGGGSFGGGGGGGHF